MPIKVLICCVFSSITAEISFISWDKFLFSPCSGELHGSLWFCEELMPVSLSFGNNESDWFEFWFGLCKIVGVAAMDSLTWSPFAVVFAFWLVDADKEVPFVVVWRSLLASSEFCWRFNEGKLEGVGFVAVEEIEEIGCLIAVFDVGTGFVLDEFDSGFCFIEVFWFEFEVGFLSGMGFPVSGGFCGGVTFLVVASTVFFALSTSAIESLLVESCSFVSLKLSSINLFKNASLPRLCFLAFTDNSIAVDGKFEKVEGAETVIGDKLIEV